MNLETINKLIIISSPSGAGKTSISKKLLKIDKSISLSISCTTRPKRKGEMHKKDYLFISEKQFTDFVKKNQFLEHAQVFGFKYGTLKKTIISFLSRPIIKVIVT